MVEPRKALVGLHGDLFIGRTFSRQLTRQGFLVEQVPDVETMLEYCGKGAYDLYLMDLNFGQEGGPDITPSRRVYALLQQQGIAGLEGKFVGVSGAFHVVEQAQREHIPAIIKTSLGDYLQNFQLGLRK